MKKTCKKGVFQFYSILFHLLEQKQKINIVTLPAIAKFNARNFLLVSDKLCNLYANFLQQHFPLPSNQDV